jgi:hypothetical protein
VWGLVVILLPFPISGCHGLDYHGPFCSGPHRVFRLLRPLRNASGQGHSTVKIPVRNEGSKSVQLLILYGVSVVNI